VEVVPLSVVKLAIAVVTWLEAPSIRWQAAATAAGFATEISRAIVAIFDFEAATAIGSMLAAAWHLEYFVLQDTPELCFHFDLELQ